MVSAKLAWYVVVILCIMYTWPRPPMAMHSPVWRFNVHNLGRSKDSYLRKIQPPMFYIPFKIESWALNTKWRLCSFWLEPADSRLVTPDDELDTDTDTTLASQGPVSERRIISHFPNWEYLLCYVKSSWGLVLASCLVETLHRSQHSSVHPVPGCSVSRVQSSLRLVTRPLTLHNAPWVSRQTNISD